MNLFLIAFSCVFVQNVVLVQFLGICPFLGVSKKTETAFGMGIAVIFVITLASVLTWLIQTYFLIPLSLEYLQTIVFILIIASLVQLVEIFLQKKIPALFASLGIYLPLITTNCAVLGVCLLSVQKYSSFLTSLFFSFFTSVGFLLSILILAGLRERLESSNIPKALQGIPITLISTSLIAIAFYAFAGLV